MRIIRCSRRHQAPSRVRILIMADKNELAALLRSNRRLARLCWAQAALIGVLAIVGWTSQKGEVRLSRLAIVDSQGRERVVLRGGDDGQGSYCWTRKVKCGAG